MKPHQGKFHNSHANIPHNVVMRQDRITQICEEASKKSSTYNQIAYLQRHLKDDIVLFYNEDIRRAYLFLADGSCIKIARGNNRMENRLEAALWARRTDYLSPAQEQRLCPLTWHTIDYNMVIVEKAAPLIKPENFQQREWDQLGFYLAYPHAVTETGMLVHYPYHQIQELQQAAKRAQGVQHA